MGGFAKPACCRSLKCGACCVFWMGIMSLGLALLAPMLLQSLIDSGITDGDVINSAAASGYEHFINYSYESDNRFIVTFFNISNAREVLMAPDVKPHLEEIGPFVYYSYRNTSNVEFGMDGDTLSYNQHAWLEFNAEETLNKTNGKYNSDRNVRITTINLLFLGMRIQAGWSYWHVICDLLLWKDDYTRLFEYRTPFELLQGYSVDVKLPDLPPIPIKFPGLFPNLPKSYDPDMTHKSTIQTGQSNPKETFQYVSWRDQTEVKVLCPYASMHLPLDEQCKANPYPCCGQKQPVYAWDTQRALGEFDENANAIQGTSGGQFRPGLHADKEQVVVFFDLAQRTMALVTTPGEGTYDYQGVHLRKFRPDRKLVWGNATERSANSRYYQLGPGGLMNLTMIFGVDVFVSLPHFLDCEPRLVDDFTGLKPDRDLHDLYIGVEPYSGITMTESQRAMISVKIQAEPKVPLLDKGWFPMLGNRTLFVPVAWFDNQALSTTEGTDQVQEMYMAIMMKQGVQWAGIGLGVLTVICAVALGIQARKQHIGLGMSLVAAGQSSQAGVQPITTSDGLLEGAAQP